MFKIKIIHMKMWIPAEINGDAACLLKMGSSNKAKYKDVKKEFKVL